MSRSRKKTPICGFSKNDSESADKRIWHKRMRAAERDRLITDPESEPTHQNEVSNAYCMAKDGKQYLGDEHQKLLRK